MGDGAVSSGALVERKHHCPACRRYLGSTWLSLTIDGGRVRFPCRRCDSWRMVDVKDGIVQWSD